MIPGPQTVATEIRSLSPVSRQDQLRLGDSELSMRAHSHSKYSEGLGDSELSEPVHSHSHSDEVLRTISNAHRLPRCPSVPLPCNQCIGIGAGGKQDTRAHTYACVHIYTHTQAFTNTHTAALACRAGRAGNLGSRGLDSRLGSVGGCPPSDTESSLRGLFSGAFILFVVLSV